MKSNVAEDAMHKFKTFARLILLLISAIGLTGCGLGGKPTPTILLGSCNLESLSGGVRDSIGNFSVQASTPDMVATGWIGNDPGGTSPEEVVISISDSSGNILISKGGSTTSRPDVATFFKKPGMANSGFEVLLENIKIPGKYTISLQGKYDNGNILCPRTFTLTVS